MLGDSSLGATSYLFGSNRRNQIASHSICANFKMAHSLLTCSLCAKIRGTPDWCLRAKMGQVARHYFANERENWRQH